MSTTLEIGCHDCKTMLWIGQRDYVYTADHKDMVALGAFLVKHKGHRLEFNAEHHFDIDCGWRSEDFESE